MKKNIKRALTVALTTVMALASVIAGPMSAKAADFDASGEYNAYMGLQTPSWSFRNTWDDKDYGKESDVWNQVTGWDGDTAIAKDGKINDAVIAGNGTYTVGVTELGDWCKTEIEGSTDGIFNLLFVSTDIPLSDSLKITDVKLIVDGKTCHTDAEAYLDPDSTEYAKILVQNIWNADKKEISFYSAPTKSVEIQFTVAGFDYDNESQKETEAPTTTAAEKDDATTAANNSDSSEKEGGNGAMIGIIIAVVVVVVIVVAVVLGKKKK